MTKSMSLLARVRLLWKWRTQRRELARRTAETQCERLFHDWQAREWLVVFFGADPRFPMHGIPARVRKVIQRALRARARRKLDEYRAVRLAELPPEQRVQIN